MMPGLRLGVRLRSGPPVEVHVPVVRPFRALRYSTEAVPDLSTVVAPPYDVIGPDEHRRLLARDPRNVVRLDSPATEAGDADPDDRYRRAAHVLAAWRGDGTLHRDPRPTVSILEDTYRLPGRDEDRVRRGFLARVRLEPLGAGIRAHERTMTGPKEDRYKLLRATGVNTSPVVAMYDEPSGRTAGLLASIASTAAAVDILDEHGVRHREWIVEAGSGPAEVLCELASAATLTIADGHHRYETALHYRDDRRIGQPDGADTGSEDILMLLLEPAGGPLDILPTHRVVVDLGETGVGQLRARLPELFEIEGDVSIERLLAEFDGTGSGESAGLGQGRFGLWTRGGGAILRARRAAFESILPAGGPGLRRLDVSLLGAALEAFAGIDADATAGGERLAYTHRVAEAIALVRDRTDGADAAFLLDPTPAREIMAVASDGDVMPQKSTYIHPKAITGLVINPLEG